MTAIFSRREANRDKIFQNLVSENFNPGNNRPHSSLPKKVRHRVLRQVAAYLDSCSHYDGEQSSPGIHIRTSHRGVRSIVVHKGCLCHSDLDKQNTLFLQTDPDILSQLSIFPPRYNSPQKRVKVFLWCETRQTNTPRNKGISAGLNNSFDQ